MSIQQLSYEKMSYRNFTVTSDEHGIAWLTLDVKDKSSNIFTLELLEELTAACRILKDESPKGLIICSGKDNGFIAGVDITKFSGIDKLENGHELALGFINAGHALCQSVEDLAFPTVSMIKGFCMGGGVELSLSCDYIITDDSPSTKLALPEILLGIHPGWGGTVRSIRKMGIINAMPIMLSGRKLLPRQAVKLGLTDKCVPERQLATTAVQTILNKPSKKRPVKYQQILEATPLRGVVAAQMRKQVASKAKQEHYPAPYALINLWEFHGSKSNDMYVAEAESVASLILTETAQNLVRVFFLQSRLKALGDKSLFKPKHVHVIGCGIMGGDIATWCAMQDLRVTIQDMNTDALAQVISRANKAFKHRYKKDRVRFMQAQDNLAADVHGDGIKKADVIIEAIFENLEVKQRLFKSVEKQAKPDALIATNTSSIPLDKIAEVMKKPERLVGLHFFNPVFKMPLLEVVQNPEQTSKDSIAKALSFAAHINKLPLPVKNSPGFLINRILMPYILEAVTLNQEGIPASIIDKVAVDYGMPMGPLELADTVGLDICLHVGKNLAEIAGVTLPTTLDKEVESGHLGKKSGQGFYRWKDDKKVKTDGDSWSGDEHKIQTRLIEKLLIESKKCLDEKIVDDADLLDAGVIFGTGFAPFRGGPMHALDEAKDSI